MDQSLSNSPPIIPLSCPQKYFNRTQIYISLQLHLHEQVQMTKNLNQSVKEPWLKRGGMYGALHQALVLLAKKGVHK